jgi:L,D-transpeptidase catalytic domain
MHRLVTAAAWVAICALLVTGSRPAAADILVNISKTAQRMSVLVDGTARYNWMVSTGGKRFTTPSGVYKPQWLARKWRSKQYANAPMPHSIFFDRGYAIHGTTEVARLGKSASHGCVRLHPDNAAKLYSLVQNQMGNTRVVVSDDLIEAPGDAPRKKPSHFVAENIVRENPVLEAMAIPQKIAEPQVTATTMGAPAETTAILHESKGQARGVQRDTQKPVRTTRADQPGFRW